MSDGAMTPIRTAMVLSAGRGLRMRPITVSTPKPLVKVAGRALLDHALDRLVQARVETVVINLHHLGAKIERHLSQRKDVKIVFSREEELLETGGGVRKALPALGQDPVFVLNSDSLWLNGPKSALWRMIERWNPAEMDALLLLQSTVYAYGYAGVGDFEVDQMGQLRRRREGTVVPYLFTGVQILKPAVFEDTLEGSFSLNLIYDRLIAEKRLYGLIHDGAWFHVGSSEGLIEAETFMNERYPGIIRRG